MMWLGVATGCPVRAADISGEFPSSERFHRQWRLKSNAVGWSLLAANVAFEVDLSERLSLSVPLYWSGFDYFRSDLKFRTFASLPELRLWLGPTARLDRFYVGVHAGFAYFNAALGGDYRYQDHQGRPALGGGVGAGWRHALTADGRWAMELALGAGIYSVSYDKLPLRPEDGLPVVGPRSCVLPIVDNVAVTFIYTFPASRR